MNTTDLDPVELTDEQKLGLTIEDELNSLIESGVTEFQLLDVKETAPSTYNILFDNNNVQSEDEENGLETSLFTVMEDPETKLFKITKK